MEKHIASNNQNNAVLDILISVKVDIRTWILPGIKRTIT